MNAPNDLLASFQEVELKQISVSTTLMQVHRRASLNKDAMKLLTENVKLVGVMQPILVRPIAKGFELVAGERRFLAAQAAGLKSIPAMVRTLTDLQALELQVIENKQREDLHELIEAEGFEELMKKHKYTAEQIADKVGMSRRYVFNRLKLLELCSEIRGEFLSGKVNASIAALLARIPVPDLQRQAAKEIAHSHYRGDEPMSVRQASEHLQRNYMLRLDQAPFKTGDETLIAKAGACGPCPKRTGNQKELFSDVKSADICTDPSCFAAKKAANMEHQRKEAEARGQTVIAGAEAKKIKPHNYGELNGGFLEVDKETYIGGKYTTVRKLLGKTLPDTTLLQDPHDEGKMIEIVQRNLVAKSLTAKGIRIDASRSSGNSADAAQRAKERKAKVETAIRSEIFTAIREKPIKLGHEELVMIAQANWEKLEYDHAEKLEAIWDWKAREGRKVIDKLDDGQLARLLLDVTLITEIKVNAYNVLTNVATNLLAVAKKVGADAAGITKKHQTEFDAKEKERADKKRKAASNAKKKIAAAAEKEADKPKTKSAAPKEKKGKTAAATTSPAPATPKPIKAPDAWPFPISTKTQ